MGETELDESIFTLAYFSKGRLDAEWAEQLGYRRRTWFLERLLTQLEREVKALERMERNLKRK